MGGGGGFLCSILDAFKLYSSTQDVLIHVRGSELLYSARKTMKLCVKQQRSATIAPWPKPLVYETTSTCVVSCVVVGPGVALVGVLV
jgi:hypothetical protein